MFEFSQEALAHLRRVRDDLRANPRDFDMERWGTCIAARLTPDAAVPDVAAMELLGLDPHTGAGSQLFYTSDWPEPYRAWYNEATSLEERVRVTTDLLDDVADNGGMWWLDSAGNLS